jgi:hypothetical protein
MRECLQLCSGIDKRDRFPGPGKPGAQHTADRACADDANPQAAPPLLVDVYITEFRGCVPKHRKVFSSVRRRGL